MKSHFKGDAMSDQSEQYVWSQIKAAFCVEGLSLRQLETKFGVPRATIARRSKQEDWRKTNSVKVMQAVETLKDSETAARQHETALSHYQENKREIMEDTGLSENETEEALQSIARIKRKAYQGAELIFDKINEAIPQTDKPQEIAQLASAHKSVCDAHLKHEAPIVAIQNSSEANAQAMNITQMLAAANKYKLEEREMMRRAKGLIQDD